MNTIQKSNFKMENLVTKFGIMGGEVVVSAINFNKLMAMPPEDLKGLFQPTNALKFRRLVLETVVNGYLKDNAKEVLMDISDLAELSCSISTYQYLDRKSLLEKRKELGNKITLRKAESYLFKDILMGMFDKKEIEVSIHHPIQFARYFGTDKNDSVGKVAKIVQDKKDLIKKITSISLPPPKDDQLSYFVNSIFPSIVRSYNTVNNRGRQLRGLRELTMHSNNLSKDQSYSLNDRIFLKQLIETAIKDNK